MVTLKVLWFPGAYIYSYFKGLIYRIYLISFIKLELVKHILYLIIKLSCFEMYLWNYLKNRIYLILLVQNDVDRVKKKNMWSWA